MILAIDAAMQHFVSSVRDLAKALPQHPVSVLILHETNESEQVKLLRAHWNIEESSPADAQVWIMCWAALSIAAKEAGIEVSRQAEVSPGFYRPSFPLKDEKRRDD